MISPFSTPYGIPIVVQLTLVPVYGPTAATARTVHSLRVQSLASGRTNLLKAEHSTAHLRAEYLQRLARGRTQALAELVKLSSGFLDDELVASLMDSGADPPSSVRRRGRPRGMTKETLEVGRALYFLVQELAGRPGASVDRVLRDLSGREFERLHYDRLKGLYYQIRHIVRPDPLLFVGDRARERLLGGPNVKTIWEADPSAS